MGFDGVQYDTIPIGIPVPNNYVFIVDEHGNTVLKEKKGIFSSTYKDANGNTVYTKDTDIFGDNQIKDNNGNIKYEDDFLDRWLWGESNYKKK